MTPGECARWYVDQPKGRMACGWNLVAVVSVGEKWTRVIGTASLELLQLPRKEFERQAQPQPRPRGLLSRIEERRKRYKRLGFGYPAAVGELVTVLRAIE